MSKILLVDDDSNFLTSTADILQNAGFETVQATTPGEFLKKTEVENPDIILLDITLEKQEDGLLAGKDLFQKGIKTPIIILENVTKVATLAVDTTEISVEAYAEKPIDAKKLITKIEAILNR